MANKEKFLSLVSPANQETQQGIDFRTENKAWLRESRNIALKVLKSLREKGLSQKDLAEKMGVSPQYINKLVKGKENFTLETLVKLQGILDVPILASYADKQEKQRSVQMFSFKGTYQRTTFSDYDSSQKKVAGYE